MNQHRGTLEERRARFEAARDAFGDLHSVLHQAGPSELAELMRLTPLLREEATQTVTTALLDLGRTWAGHD